MVKSVSHPYRDAQALTPAHRPLWFNETLYPFKGQYLDISGCQVHYLDEGAGPVLLLLHGNPAWSFLYREIITGLRHRFRCVALDYPGFGLSSASKDYGFTPAEHAQVVEQFIQKLGLTDITLMVQDWGGPIGLGVAGRHPGRFQALVIGNTFAWPVNGIPHFERFSNFMGGPLGGFLIQNFNAFVNLLIPAGVTRRRLPPEIMQAYRGAFPTPLSRRPTHVFPRQILHSRSYLAEVEQGLARLKHLPALILWGDRDIAFRAAERERFEQLFPNHKTKVLSGAGHFIQEDAPDEIIEAINAWWPGAMERLQELKRGGYK